MPIELSSSFSSSNASDTDNIAMNGDSMTHPRANSIIKFEEDKFHSARIAMKEELMKLLEFLPQGSKKRFLFEKDMESFYLLFLRFLRSINEKKLDWNIVKGPSEEKLVPYASLSTVDDNQESHRLLSKLAVVKLNGGLGTTMGCVGPKSVIEVREGQTFLDLAVRQIEVTQSSHNCFSISIKVMKLTSHSSL